MTSPAPDRHLRPSPNRAPPAEPHPPSLYQLYAEACASSASHRTVCCLNHRLVGVARTCGHLQVAPILARNVSSPLSEKIPRCALPFNGMTSTASSPSAGNDCSNAAASPLNATPSPKDGAAPPNATAWPSLT